MSTKTETDSTIKFDPTAMSTFRNLQGPIQNTLLDYMNDPRKASYFTQQIQLLSKANQGLLTRNTQNILTQAGQRGITPNSALTSSLLGRAARGSSANMNNSYLQALMQAEGNRKWATNQAQGYTPLRTGQTDVTKTSGLGTWLPQVIGGALSLAMAPMTGGTSLLGMLGAAGKGAGAAAGGVASAANGASAFGGSNMWNLGGARYL